MDVTTAYTYTVGRLPEMFEAIKKAQVPPKFTHEFLQALGFKSTNDRAFINVMKGLGFVDANSTPTTAYGEYRDPAASKKVLARQIRLAYQGLFQTDDNAHSMTPTQVKGRLAAITGKDEKVTEKMATTFTALCKLADFAAPTAKEEKAAVAKAAEEQVVESPALKEVQPKPQALAFSHTVYINLPTTRDVAVYDAIFKSVREHLL